jgi:hypothetical protein
MRDRALAYERVLALAQQAGLDAQSEEMQRFARSLFWMSRNVAAQGLSREAARLLELAMSVSIGPRWDLRIYAAATRVLGWTVTVKLAQWMEARRGRTAGARGG